MPAATDYAEAVQNPSVAFLDADLKAGQVATNALGLPLSHTGSFAAVFEIASQTGEQKWATKCFTRRVPGLQDRYHHIAAHLELHRNQLPFTVNFQYLPEGILVHGQWHPVLKMDWVEGLTLDKFLADCLTKPNYKSTLRMLCDMWLRMARMLREANVGHGDLQHGNVLLVPAPEKGGYHLRLIDYDGMYVPALADYPSSECGHAAYQHPERLSTDAHGLEVDRFSHLLIYCTLRCLIAGGPKLWDRHYDGDRLLLGPQDLEKPDDSPVFRELWQLPEPAVRNMVGHLIVAAKGRSEVAPQLNQLVDGSRVAPVPAAQRAYVDQWMSAAAVSVGRTTPPPLPQTRKYFDTDAVREAALPAETPASPIAAETVRRRLPLAVLLNWVTRPLLMAVRPFDRLLGTLAGGGNAILHNFLRVALAVGVVTVGALLAPRVISYVSTRIEVTRVNRAAEEEARQRQEDEARQLAEAERVEVFLEKEITVELASGGALQLVLIPAGSFTMGDANSSSDEKPSHWVTITQPFYIGKYEVTQAQWEAVMGSNPSTFKGLKNPVGSVSWRDCHAFLAKLNENPGHTGHTFRLPTEAQWEYACRAGSTSQYSFGDHRTSLGDYAWFQENSGGQTHPVGGKKPNAWGLYDMHGNVEEWCQDWYDDGYYAESPRDDPTGPASGSSRVIRGGSWTYVAGLCRAAYRDMGGPVIRSDSLGFRVAAVPSGKST